MLTWRLLVVLWLLIWAIAACLLFWAGVCAAKGRDFEAFFCLCLAGYAVASAGPRNPWNVKPMEAEHNG